jgi:hypothetical protein
MLAGMTEAIQEEAADLEESGKAGYLETVKNAVTSNAKSDKPAPVSLFAAAKEKMERDEEMAYTLKVNLDKPEPDPRNEHGYSSEEEHHVVERLVIPNVPERLKVPVDAKPKPAKQIPDSRFRKTDSKGKVAELEPISFHEEEANSQRELLR